MGNITSRSPDSHVQDLTVCHCFGVKTDENERSSHCWPGYCQWWDNTLQKKCLCCIYQEDRKDTDYHSGKHRTITPCSYYSESRNRSECCAFGVCNWISDHGFHMCIPCLQISSRGDCCTLVGAKWKNSRKILYSFDKSTGCHAGYLFGACKDTHTERWSCWTPCMGYCNGYACIPLVCSYDAQRLQTRFDHWGLFHDIQDESYCDCLGKFCRGICEEPCCDCLPDNFCCLGCGTTRDYYISPLGCIRKDHTEFYTLCGYHDGKSGCLPCLCSRIESKWDGTQFTNDVEMNNQLSRYVAAHPEHNPHPMVKQRVAYVKGCIYGTWHFEPVWDRQEKIRALQNVAKWADRNPQEIELAPPVQIM